MLKMIGAALVRPFVVIWNYFRNGWEGDDGKFSYRRIFQYLFGGSAIIIGLQQSITGIQYKVVVLFCMMFLIMAGLMTVQQLLYFYRGSNLLEDESDDYSEGMGDLPAGGPKDQGEDDKPLG